MEVKELKRLPVGIQTYDEIVNNNWLYIDKTEYIYKMVNLSKYVFLSRPRRFGKSLLVSTLAAYFEGKRYLFKGTYIDSVEKDWTEYPVLRFDMSLAKHRNKEDLPRYLLYIIERNEKKFGLTSDISDPNLRLTNLIQSAYEQTGKQVVVLIDEYDAPLLDVAHEKVQLDDLRQIMRNFYSPLKACDNYLKFVFITGITKFSQLSIFSE
ncbi:MAG: AAA family ATPase, partial [Candidatus Limisoma sp.]